SLGGYPADAVGNVTDVDHAGRDGRCWSLEIADAERDLAEVGEWHHPHSHRFEFAREGRAANHVRQLRREGSVIVRDVAHRIGLKEHETPTPVFLRRV